jgi:hypothetical protein
MKRNSFHVGEVHSFSRPLARTHGINAAILMAFLAHRIPAVESARKDERGYYAPVKVLAKHYPYLTASTISYTLNQLREKGVLLANANNRRAYDRTLWYRFADPKVQQLALEDPIRFNVELAQLHGVEAAMVLANVDYWIRDNRKKDNRYDWHRVSPPVMAKHLPLSERTIRRVLDKLCLDEVLDRKPAPGCDRAYQYRFFCASETDRPTCEYERPVSEKHRSNLEMDRPELQMNRPDLKTYTLCEDNFVKPSVVKNLCEKPMKDTLAAPKSVSSLTIFGFAGADDSSAQSIRACGQDTGRRDVKSNGDATVPGSSRGEFSSGTVNESRAKQDAFARFNDRIEKYASPYAHLEDEPGLTADQKRRVFKQAVISMRRIGVPEGERGFKLVYSDKTFDKAKRFFELNPDVTVSDVKYTIETCQFLSRVNEKPDGYDEMFYERRAENLDFFFKHIVKFSTLSCDNSLAGCIGLDDQDDLQPEILSPIGDFSDEPTKG